MWKLLLNGLLSVKGTFQKFAAKIFARMRSPETGKLKGISPKNVKPVAGVVLGSLFFLILLSQIFTRNPHGSNDVEEFKKESQADDGIRSRQVTPIDLDSNDPLASLKNKAKKWGGDSDDKNSGKDASGGLPTVSECFEVLDLLKSGKEMSQIQKDKLKVCTEKNIFDLNKDDLAMVKALQNPNITAEERALFQKALRGELDDKQLAAARALAGLVNGDGSIGDRALLLKAAQEGKLDPETRDAVASQLSGKTLSSEEQALIDKARGTAEGTGGATTGEATTGGARLSKEDELKNLARSVSDKDSRIKSMEAQMAEAQAQASSAAKRLAAGERLGSVDQEKLIKAAQLQKEIDKLKAEKDRQLRELSRQWSSLQNTMAQVAKTVEETVPSGFTVGYQDSPTIACKDIKSLGVKVAKKTKPTQVQLAANKTFQLERKKMLEFRRTKKDLLNPMGKADLGERVDVAAMFAANGTQGVEIASLFVASDKTNKPFTLTPDMRIPAVLESQILISDKGGGMRIRVRVLMDVFNPSGGGIVIPKGSIATGTTAGFDADTGIMNLSFDSVTIGGGKVVAVKFNVGSGDGTMGLRGEVRDNRGKYLLGAFVTSFSSGILSWFSQNVVQGYQQSVNLNNALIGSGANGGSEVMKKISEIYASDLQNAPKIFYAPKNVPIILFPE